MSDVDKLISLAQAEDGLNNSEIDTFLRMTGYTVNDLSERITLEQLYSYYSHYFYLKYGKLPHSKRFTHKSGVILNNKLKKRHGGRIVWGLKCSKLFKETFNQWLKKYPDWQRTLEKIKAAIKGRRTIKAKQKASTMQNDSLD